MKLYVNDHPASSADRTVFESIDHISQHPSLNSVQRSAFSVARYAHGGQLDTGRAWQCLFETADRALLRVFPVRRHRHTKIQQAIGKAWRDARTCPVTRPALTVV